MMNGEKVLIVSAMKNEGPYILEWVAHHLAMGVDNILVFTNDCDDGTERILERLGAIAPVQQVPNPKSLFDKGNWQVMALRYARLFNVYADAAWIYHTDADEFLHIAVGDGTLDAFHAAAQAKAGRFDAVSFTSMPYSSGGALELTDEPVTSRFTKMSKHYGEAREKGTPVFNAVKTLYRNDVKFDMRRNHRPLMKNFSAQGHVWIDGSARQMPPEYTDDKTKVMDATVSVDLAQMNHYAIKCAEAFLVKLDRGDVAGTDRLDTDRQYWQSYNADGDEELRFAKLSPKAQALYDSFRADPVLGPLHANALAVHQAKVRRMKADPARAPMLDRLGLQPDAEPAVSRKPSKAAKSAPVAAKPRAAKARSK